MMAEKQFCTFYLDNTLFGIDIMVVSDIYRHLEMTPVHRLPSYVRGLLNLRGQIVTVLDLGVRFGLEPREIKEDTRCIILKTDSDLAKPYIESGQKVNIGSHVIGLLVDKIGEVVRVQDNKIENPPANVGKVAKSHLTGVFKMNEELLSIIKVAEAIN
jgi:purine-binding chemotaxis protein CheW